MAKRLEELSAVAKYLSSALNFYTDVSWRGRSSRRLELEISLRRLVLFRILIPY